jgi:hypothetical protein
MCMILRNLKTDDSRYSMIAIPSGNSTVCIQLPQANNLKQPSGKKLTILFVSKRSLAHQSLLRLVRSCQHAHAIGQKLPTCACHWSEVANMCMQLVRSCQHVHAIGQKLPTCACLWSEVANMCMPLVRWDPDGLWSCRQWLRAIPVEIFSRNLPWKCGCTMA